MFLRDYQTEACGAVYDSFKSGKGNPLVDLPTGSGKSLVIAELAKRAVYAYSGRVVIVAHRKELLSQNAEKIRALVNVPVGLYSAGLRSRDIEQDIIVAGIQSVHGKASELGRRHLVIIDEAHLIPKTDSGMYRSFLGDLARYNPNLRVAGLTATPFRLDSGKLWGPGELFSHVAYRGNIRSMIEQGYLCPLTTTPSTTAYDTGRLHIRGGEYVRREVEDLFGDSELAGQACRELVEKASGRKSILVFCSGVEHAYQVQEILANITGERVECVTGDTPPIMRAAVLEAFGHGDFRWCVNVDVLTTGFDNPRIDCVAIMRATQSAGLYCQIVGRALRTHPSKADSLIIDFGNNIRTHGPIDAVDFGVSKEKGEAGEAPVKSCPNCNVEVAAGTRECECGFLFPFERKQHDTRADEESKILSEPETFQVRRWMLSKHYKKGDDTAPTTLRVTYFVEGDLETAIEEWVCLNHEGYAGKKAEAWWSDHSDENLSELAEAMEMDRVDAAVETELRGYVRCPATITATREGRWWRVIGRTPGVARLPEVEDDDDIPF